MWVLIKFLCRASSVYVGLSSGAKERASGFLRILMIFVLISGCYVVEFLRCYAALNALTVVAVLVSLWCLVVWCYGLCLVYTFRVWVRYTFS